MSVFLRLRSLVTELLPNKCLDINAEIAKWKKVLASSIVG